MTERKPMSSMAGFTLLEIMVALAIFATLAAAVLSASQYVLKQSSAVEQRLFAAWLADNQLNELRLQSRLEVGQQQRLVQMDQRDWQLRQHISATDDPRLLRADVHVSVPGREHTLHRATGWIPVRDQ
jgi:general secretion pathway protein I